MPSIVIPAHDEERSISGLLSRLAPLAPEFEIVVACNGCSDRTVDIARAAAPWATVLDLAEASKPAALNAGDAACSTFPRMYLDADVSIDAYAIREVFKSLDGRLEAAAATPVYDTAGAGRLVRSHQRFWERLPANNQGIAGTNAMAVTEIGRKRFEEWPALIGDDYFLDGLFEPAEKSRIATATIVRSTPRRFYDCISRKARIEQGNRDVRAAGLRAGHNGGGASGIKSVLKADPVAALDLPAHVLVTVSARALSWWRRRRGSADVWFRDGSRTKD